MKNFLQRRRLMWLAVLFNAIGYVCDLTSSYGAPAYLFESNPYTRDIVYHFSLLHGMIYDSIWLGIFALVGCLLYFGTRWFDELIAQLAFAALPLVAGIGGFSAAVHNVWLRLGWYVR